MTTSVSSERVWELAAVQDNWHDRDQTEVHPVFFEGTESA